MLYCEDNKWVLKQSFGDQNHFILPSLSDFMEKVYWLVLPCSNCYVRKNWWCIRCQMWNQIEIWLHLVHSFVKSVGVDPFWDFSAWLQGLYDVQVVPYTFPNQENQMTSFHLCYKPIFAYKYDNRIHQMDQKTSNGPENAAMMILKLYLCKFVHKYSYYHSFTIILKYCCYYY